MPRSIFFCCFLMLQGVASTQEIIRGNLFNHIDGIIENLPGRSDNDYANPSGQEATTWYDLFQHIGEKRYADAANLAPDLDYQFIQFIDNTRTPEEHYYILEKINAGGNYWGTYVFNPNACRQVVIQAPHPKNDANTGQQGIYVFQNTNAYAYFLSGTHRCNAAAASNCSGTTSTCGSSAPYRRSDVAHNTLSGFHIATEVLLDAMNDLYFIQLHGFSKRETDPYVILSNGSRTIPDLDFVVAIRDGLLSADPSLSFKIGHLDLDWTRLLAFTNTQGRYINNSSTPCTESASAGNGKFIHIEQERTKLRAGSTQWTKMQTAVEMAFPCITVAVKEIASAPTLWKLQLNGRIQFDLPEGQNYELRFFNLFGQIIFTRTISPKEVVTLTKGTAASGVFQIFSKGNFIASGKFLNLN